MSSISRAFRAAAGPGRSNRYRNTRLVTANSECRDWDRAARIERHFRLQGSRGSSSRHPVIDSSRHPSGGPLWGGVAKSAVGHEETSVPLVGLPDSRHDECPRRRELLERAQEELRYRQLQIISGALGLATCYGINALGRPPYSELRVTITDALSLPGALIGMLFYLVGVEPASVLWAVTVMVSNWLFYAGIWLAFLSVARSRRRKGMRPTPPGSR